VAYRRGSGVYSFDNKGRHHGVFDAQWHSDERSDTGLDVPRGRLDITSTCPRDARSSRGPSLPPRYRGGSDGCSYRLRFPGCPPLNLKSEDVLLGESLAVLVHRPNGNPVEWDERTDSIDDSGPGLVEERRSGCGAAQVIQQLVDVGLRLAGCPEEAEGQW